MQFLQSPPTHTVSVQDKHQALSSAKPASNSSWPACPLHSHLQAASPVPFGLFGSRPTTPAVQEEEEEEVVVAASPALPFAGLFGAKRAPVQVGGFVVMLCG